MSKGIRTGTFVIRPPADDSGRLSNDTDIKDHSHENLSVRAD
jgi:hypothetical protein